MIVFEAADLAVTLIDRALLTAGVIAAALVFVVAVAVCMWALQPPKARRGRCAPAGAPQRPSRASRVAGDAPGPAQSRTANRVPAWAHTEPYTYEEAA